jgi:hypothetical protein
MQVAKLTASDGAAGAELGQSVAIDGNTIVVGAFDAKVGVNTNQGAAYVYTQPAGGWAGALTETAKLTASDGAHNDGLGISVGISGGTVVVGAANAAVSGNAGQGAGYVFVAPWSGTVASPQHESAKLTASDGTAGDQLGFSAAVSGNTVVAGAYHLTVTGNAQQGAGYVFVAPAGGWTGTAAAPQHESAKLTASDGAAGDRLFYGNSTAISGNTVVAGAYQAQVGTNLVAGAAYVFVASAGGWAGPQHEAAKLTAADAGSGDRFGTSVGISGGTVVAGSPFANIGANFAQGAVYVFVAPTGGWAGPQHETAKLTAGDGATGDKLGYSVGISGTTVVAGAPTAMVGGVTNQGAAYVFDMLRRPLCVRICG